MEAVRRTKRAGLPEVVKALASPLANVDKITIVSTGNGDAAGMNKITGDLTLCYNLLFLSTFVLSRVDRIVTPSGYLVDVP